MRSWMKQAVATGVSGALILTTPGLPAYRVFAAQFVAPVTVQPAAPVGGLGAAGVSAVGSVQAPLGTGVQTAAGLASALPNLGSNAPLAPAISVFRPVSAENSVVSGVSPVAPGLAGRSPAVPGSMGAIGTSGLAGRSPAVPGSMGAIGTSGRVGQALIRRVQARETAPKGLMEVLVGRVQGRSAAPAGKWLKPASENLNTGASSKDWGTKSFDALRGAAVSDAPGGAVDAARHDSGAVKPGGLFGLRRSVQGRSQASPEVPGAPGKEKKAKPKANPKVQLAISIIAAAGFGLASYNHWWIFGNPVSVFGWFTMTWPMMLGIQAAFIGVKAFKLWKDARKEKNLKAAEKAEAEARHDPKWVESENAARILEERAADGKHHDVSIYEDLSGQFHPAPITAELIEKVRAGEYEVATDDTGAISLARIEKPADEATPKAEKTAPKAEETTPKAEEAQERVDENARNEAVENRTEPVRAEPRSRRGLYGAAIGSAVGLAVALFFPVESIIVPVIAYAIAEGLPARGVERGKRSLGTLAGVAAGTLGMVYLASFGVPHLLLIALPAAGAALGYGIERFIDSRKAAAAAKPIEKVEPVEPPAAEETPAEPVENDGVVSPAKTKEAVVQAPRLEPAAPAEEKVEEKIEDKVEEPPVELAAPAPNKSSNRSGLAGDAPRSFKTFNAEARGMDAASLLAGKTAAQKRARRIAKDARLVRVGHNLGDTDGKTFFVFHSRKSRKIITVYKTRVDVKSDARPGKTGEGRWVYRASQGSTLPLKNADALWDTRLGTVGSLEAAYARLKRESHWFKPVRVEIIPRYKKDPVFAFIDAEGRVRTIPVPAKEEKKPETPAKEKPDAKKTGREGSKKEKKKEQPPIEKVDEPVARPPVSPPAGEGVEEKAPNDENLGPPEARAPPGEPGPKAGTPKSDEIRPHLHEDFFGFRRVRGLRHDSDLARLPSDASTSQIIEQIARQFGLTRDRVVELGVKYAVTEKADAAAWFAVFDTMQKANRAEFEHLDQKKYQGGLLAETGSRLLVLLRLKKKVKEAGFRKLANKSYAPGIAGVLQRTVEVHKHLIGAVFRFPYHLLDMFFFGYFRRAASYEFFHSNEDFITVRERLTRKELKEKGKWTSQMEQQPPMVERWLESALQRQMVRGVKAREKFLAHRGVRLARRWIVAPLAAPAFKFVWRRATLAIFSAVAMGLVAGLVPAPFLGFHLTAVPVLGPALIDFGWGVPMLASKIPFIGDGLAQILGAGVNALIGDLSVGNIFQVLTLSSILTFPAALKQRLMDRRLDKLSTPKMYTRAFFYGALGTMVSWTFWSQNLKSMFGLMLIGAEIEGVMTYATEIDGFFNRAYQPVTGHEFKLFHTIGAAVERPEGESPVPFGGAITWGNILIYKFQNLLGFNITDETYRLAHGAVYGNYDGAAGEAYLDAARGEGPVAVDTGISAVAGAVSVIGAGAVPEAAKFKLGTQAQMSEGRDKAKRSVGEIEAEMARVRARIALLSEQIKVKENRLLDLKERSKPISADDMALYEKTMKDLAEKRNEEYVQAKLSEIYDLKNPAADAAKTRVLEELMDYYASLLPEETKNPGYQDALGVKVAILHTVEESLKKYDVDPKTTPPKPTPLDEALAERIEPLVTELEKLRADAEGELVNRESLSKLINAVSKTRNLALRDRRSGAEMLEFHKNFAKLATVMDLAFSLNTINAAQQAIAEMKEMLQAKLDKINKVKADSEAAAAANAEQQREKDRWIKELKEKIGKDNLALLDMIDLEDQTSQAVKRIGSFRTSVTALLARIDAEDSGASANALEEYKRRLALLPTLRDWAENGKPGDEDYVSMKLLREHLVDIEDYITKMADGLNQIDSTPLEFAGVLVLAVPGVPDYSASNPSQAQTLQILAERKAHWQEELKDYKERRDDLRNMTNPSYSGTETDDFGDSHPVSLPKRKAEAQSTLNASRSKSAELTRQIDAAAAKIRSVVPGADLPNLSGLDLEGLQDAVESYADKMSAVNFPGEFTPEIFGAKMALFEIGENLPALGHEVIKWSKADAEIEHIDEALVSPLPQALDLYEKAVTTIESVIADVDADVAYVQNGGDNQALIDRKKALLQGIQPVLQTAKTAINDHLIPFQQQTIDGYADDADGWAKLFDAQITLYEGTKEALEKKIPWAIAASGAPMGDKAAGLANIDTMRKKFNDLMTGYDDADGHHSGVQENLDEIAKLKDPNNTEMEESYGQLLPKSLPRLKIVMAEENAQRAGQINQQHSEINAILADIDSRTGGKYTLSRFTLPTGINSHPGANEASVAKIQALVDNDVYQNLADALSQIGDDYRDQMGDLDTGSGDQTIPQGTQPNPTVDNATQIVLRALEAAKRIVPSSQGGPESAPAAYAVARYLYSDGAWNTAHLNLTVRIPRAEAFLGQAKTALQNGQADLDIDTAYVNSNGTSETHDAVIDRKIAIFGELNAVTREGIDFYTEKLGWDNESWETIDDMDTYYGALNDVYENSGTVTDNEVEAIQTMIDSLQETFDDLEEQRKKLTRWMSQLNRPEESALKRVAEDLRKIQEKTRAVLEQNMRFRELEGKLNDSNEIIKWNLRRQAELQARLAEELKAMRDPGTLKPDLRHRIEQLRISGRSWALSGKGGDAAALVIPKKDFGRFIEVLFSNVLSRSASTRDLGGIQQGILNDPTQLASVIPNAEVLEFGDADGFYLVYQSQFSVPHGLETSSWVTLGNVARVWGNNISVTGYQFASPPNDENAPWGDKGVEVQIESLQGRNWVNYLNIDFHRFIQDIPPDTSMASSARQSRLLLFNDFAMMLFGDRLYVAVTGFGDIATDNPGDKTSFYGGSVKTSLKLTEVARLNAEQQQIFAKDPRYFLQNFNLDFTGLDPDLDQDFVIESHGENKHYKRTQVGPEFDVAKLLKSEDAFTVELYWARQEGTDDYDQDALGISVLKGFTLKDSQGKPWMVISNKAGAELGDAYNTLSDKVSVTLPKQGIVVSAEGRLIGDAKTYYAQVAKKTGSNSSIALGYGSKYVGQEPRLTISMNTGFTLGELWRAVSGEAQDALTGSKALEKYNKELDDFFEAGKDDARVREMASVFRRDIGAKLIQQDIGLLAKEIAELRKAGAFMDNSRVRGMVGYVAHPIGDSTADRAVGGGFVAGTSTEMQLNKTQKEQIDSKIQSLYRESLRLQFRMLELTKQWQEVVTEIAQAQWELKMALFMAAEAPNEALRAEGKARAASAELRLNQATIRYNMLTGRSPQDALPFENLSVGELEALLQEIRKLTASPDKLAQVLHGLDPEQIEGQLGKNPFNVMDWIPWIEQITFTFGVQFQDGLSNQALGLGAQLRLPFYDPSSKERDKAYVLQSQAVIQELHAVYEEYGLASRKALLESKAWESGAEVLGPQVGPSASALADAIRAYRNGMISESRLREAFEQWRWYAGSYLLAESRRSLTAGWSTLDASFARERSGVDNGPLDIGSFDEAFAAAGASARSLAEVEARRQAAAHMLEANRRRIEKFAVDLHIGWNLTADGVGWIPSFGITGIGITPILTFELKPDELRDLQVVQAEGQGATYEQMKTKLEAELAVDFYRAVVLWSQSGQSVSLLQTRVIPELQAKLARARAEASPGDPEGRVAAARRTLAEAERRLILADQTRKTAAATINHLLGRLPSAPISLSLTPEAAKRDLLRLLDAKKPVEADKNILETRVTVARAVETMIDKNLKVEQLRVEPVSLVVRSLGRLVAALSDDSIGNPDLMARARVQTLNAERANDSFEGDLEVRRAQLRTELSAAEAGLQRALGRTDEFAALDAVEFRGKIDLIEGALARLGAAPEGRGKSAVPASFHEMRDRVMSAEQSVDGALRDAGVDVFEPEYLPHNSKMNVRYYNLKMDLGTNPIGEHYVETWFEIRLKEMGTPPEVLMALSRLRLDKADRVHRNNQAAARSRATILISQFETNVRLLRWAESLQRSPGSQSARREFAAFVDDVRARVDRQGGRIKALLDLPDAVPVSELARLVPEDAGGASKDLEKIATRFVTDVKSLPVSEIRKALFEDGIPAVFGNEDGLINQLKADVIAERMSYKGFTPVFAFGMFRGVPNQGVFLEAPDPRSIERGLTRVLSDSMRKELQSQGRMQEMALRLHLLMSAVSDRTRVVEKLGARMRAEESSYYAAVARFEQGLIGRDELFKAQDALVKSWLDLSREAATLKNDFIELVTELEAIGYKQEDLLKTAATVEPEEAARVEADPYHHMASYAARRMLDENFVSALSATLLGLKGFPPEVVARLRDNAAAYREMTDAASQVRHHDGIGTAEKLDLLTKADVEGRREKLYAELYGIISAARKDPAGRAAIAVFLKKDLEYRMTVEGGLQARELETLAEMRVAYAGAMDWPYAVRGAVTRLEDLRSRVEAAEQNLRQEFMKSRVADPVAGGASGTAVKFLLQDQALDRYLKAVEKYDAEVAKTFAMSEVRDNPGLAKTLDGLYSARESLKRGRDLAVFGRGILAIDALEMLQETRLAAQRFERAPRSERDRTLAALRGLKELRAHWESGDTRELQPVYAETEVDEHGNRNWDATKWYTFTEIQGMIEEGLLVEKDGRLWRKFTENGKEKAVEITVGVDGALMQRDGYKKKAGLNETRVELHEIFEKNEFALVDLSNGEVKGIDYPAAMDKASKGRAFHFSRELDSYKLHPAVHPLKALWRDPAGTQTILYMGEEAYSADRFPTFESLMDHIERLKTGTGDLRGRFRSLTLQEPGMARTDGESDDDFEARLAGRVNELMSAEAGKFLRLEPGPKGVMKMMEYAKEHRRRAASAGWVSVKLQTYGFSTDPEGKPAETYLTEAEFEAEKEDLENAAKIVVERRGALLRLKVERDAARAARDAQKPVVDALTLEFQTVEREARERIGDEVAKDKRYARKEGESDKDYAKRLKDRVNELVVDDKAFENAQENLSEAVDKYNELEKEYFDLKRKMDESLAAYKDAGRLIAHANLWESRKEAYLKTLAEIGLKEDDVARESKRLAAEGVRSLFVTRDAVMHVDAEGALSRITATPVFGRAALDDLISDPHGAVREVRGELFAAVMDKGGYLVKMFMDDDSVDAAGRNWKIEDVRSTPEKAVVFRADNKAIDPNYRLKHYVDDDLKLPVMLNRRYMISKLTGSGKAVSNAESWAYGPWNWGNILMELPRGLVQAPIEIITGRDPNQHGYLGRAHMMKVEGGSTEHHGFFRKVAGVIDILDLLPDPVEWYFDPSQFPDSVSLDKPIRPGETIYDRDLRAGDKDVHFGRLHGRRTVIYDTEDLVNANRRVLSYFEGGIEDTMIEHRRGRDGAYQTSRITESNGVDALERALDDKVIAAHPNSYITDGPVTLSGEPGHIAVDRVERRVRLRPGVEQYGRMIDGLAQVPERLEAMRKDAEAQAPVLREALKNAQSGLDSRVGETAKLRTETDALWDKHHELAWKVGRQQAIEAEMKRLEDEIRDLKDELAQARKRLEELQEELDRAREENPGDPNDPADPEDPNNPERPNLPPWAPWLGLALLIAAAIILLEWLRRRRSPAFA